MTPEDQQRLGDYLAGYDRELLDLQDNYQRLAAQIARDAGDVTGGNWRTVTNPGGSSYREYLGGGQLSNSGRLWAQGAAAQQSADNALAARGLERSSIRDSALGDIAATTTMQRMNMLSQLSQLAASNERIRAHLDNQRRRTQANFDALAVRTAQAQPPAPDPAPTPAPTAAPTAPRAPTVRPAAVGGITRVRAVPRPVVRGQRGPRLVSLNAARRRVQVRPRRVVTRPINAPRGTR